MPDQPIRPTDPNAVQAAVSAAGQGGSQNMNSTLPSAESTPGTSVPTPTSTGTVPSPSTTAATSTPNTTSTSVSPSKATVQVTTLLFPLLIFAVRPSLDPNRMA